MSMYLLAVALGLVLLVWSADRFVAGSAALAARRGVPPLVIGMLVIGFGTSMPELTVSALAAADGATGIALGNAWGSNTVNIGLILGLTALLSPITVRSGVLRREMPVLLAVTALAVVLAFDLSLSRLEGAILLAAFAAFVLWSIKVAREEGDDPIGDETAPSDMSERTALVWTIVGLALLIAASRAVVWGAVGIAEGLGVSDIVIGLTIVAVGTSLPELASSLVSIRRGAHELALGNIIGSNIFNALAVVGVALSIGPATIGAETLWRDLGVMSALTLALFLFGFPLTRRPGRINRLEGGALLAAWVGYTGWLGVTSLG